MARIPSTAAFMPATVSEMDEILDQREGKPLWQRSGLLLEGDYEPGREADGREKALDRLVTNIVEGAQSQW